MRRRLEQLIETNRRYDHPFVVAVFDASGPGAREADGGRETVLAILGAALRDSIRIIDEAFRLEEDAMTNDRPLLAVEHLRIAHVRNLADWLAEAKEAGFWIWGADADAKQAPWDTDLTGPTVVVTGNRVRRKANEFPSLKVTGAVASVVGNIATGGADITVVSQAPPPPFADNNVEANP